MVTDCISNKGRADFGGDVALRRHHFGDDFGIGEGRIDLFDVDGGDFGQAGARFVDGRDGIRSAFDRPERFAFFRTGPYATRMRHRAASRSTVSSLLGTGFRFMAW